MADATNAQREKDSDDELQDGAVRDADSEQAEGDVTSGGAPEEPDTPDRVYSGDSDGE